MFSCIELWISTNINLERSLFIVVGNQTLRRITYIILLQQYMKTCLYNDIPDSCTYLINNDNNQCRTTYIFFLFLPTKILKRMLYFSYTLYIVDTISIFNIITMATIFLSRLVLSGKCTFSFLHKILSSI